MKVRIKGDISGSRNGAPWPKRGEDIELPDDEAAQLCASGLAAPVKAGDAEKAVPDASDVETRSGGLTKATAGAVTADGPQSEDGDDQDDDSGDDDQAAAKDQDPAPAPKTTPARKTAAKRVPAKPAESK